MSIYFEKARELGNLILTSEQAKNLADASAAFNKNEEAKEKLEEYKKYSANVQESADKKLLGKEELKIATQRLTEMVVDLKKDPDVAALTLAEGEFNGFVNQVMNILKLTITGAPVEEEENNKEGNGGCGGCSSSSDINNNSSGCNSDCSSSCN